MPDVVAEAALVDVAHFLTVILIVAPLSAMLVPIIGTLLFFTPPHTRRRPVFVLNICACLVGILQAVLILSLNVAVLLNPDQPLAASFLLLNVAAVLIPPVLIDAILLFRLLAFYPVQLTLPRTLATVLAFPILVKLARIGLAIAFMVTYPVDRLGGARSQVIAGLLWGRGTLVEAIFALQALDNAYASSIFLYKLYRFRKNGQNVRPFARPRILQDEVLIRLPSIFLIALGNYVFPVAMNIVQIALMGSRPHFMSGVYIVFVNNFVTILGVVFATIWTSKQNWALRRMLGTPTFDDRPLSTIQFRVKSLSTMSSVFDPDEELGFWPSVPMR
ncbi:hypothetical protein OF83DRAFT_1058033 [Amylostereum chailletii]|nr:hypothetical protein OF83DRAFT_1058033 [Amylostereum chailletii]